MPVTPDLKGVLSVTWLALRGEVTAGVHNTSIGRHLLLMHCCY